MDNDTFQIILFIVVVVGIFEFFHIGYLVNSINKQMKKQTKYLQAMFMTASGQKSIVGRTWVTWSQINAQDRPGEILVGDELWDYKSEETINAGATVRVKELSGITLVVENVPKQAER